VLWKLFSKIVLAKNDAGNREAEGQVGEASEKVKVFCKVG